MRFNIYREARLSLLILSIVILISFAFCILASMFTSMGYKGLRTESKDVIIYDNNLPVIIIDAGHGGEDPGAVDNGLTEKDLNLEFANILEKILSANGYKTYLTRSDDRLLYNTGEEKRKKYYDIRNRLEFARRFDNAIFVSIHMNKFAASYCEGFQAFYGDKNQSGKILAECIQKSVLKLQTDNHRTIKNGKDTIFLLENLERPATLIECGFISNSREAGLLKNGDYKLSLVMSIFCGIANYMESNDEK